MRSFNSVINEILSVVPRRNANFRNNLIELMLIDMSYKSPEDTIQWDLAQQVLIEHIPRPVKEWHFKALSVFSGR